MVLLCFAYSTVINNPNFTQYVSRYCFTGNTGQDEKENTPSKRSSCLLTVRFLVYNRVAKLKHVTFMFRVNRCEVKNTVQLLLPRDLHVFSTCAPQPCRRHLFFCRLCQVHDLPGIFAWVSSRSQFSQLHLKCSTRFVTNSLSRTEH